jgi:alkanesulfonate monooxygenase SsuD/methylene tetrahydromethanopterin reductase-like flavin-dependent oxidoreductase (luciferase family)
MLFGLRFDFRNPELGGVSMADRYSAALDMAEWADALGCVTIAVSEHHGSDDGYLPSPLMMLSAMAARTTNVRFMVAALITSFYDPIRLAEDLVVLDNISRGRVDLVLGSGYVPSEFEMYGVKSSERAARLTETMATLRAAFTGEPFEFRGREIRVTPAPHRPGGPGLMLGGSSEVAARRAARMGAGFIPVSAEVWEFYRNEVQLLGGTDPGPSMVGANYIVALHDDVERGWDELGPYFLHETNAYGAWHEQSGVDAPFHVAADIDELRQRGTHRIVTPEQFVTEMRAAPFAFQMFHPMCGGIPPELAWTSLKLFEHEVLPAFS